MTFKAPSVTVDESALSSLDKIEIYMDGELLHTFDTDVTPGAAYTYEIADTKTIGYHDFEVYAYNSEGQGVPAMQHRYIGVPVPGAPESAKFINSEVIPGEMNVIWSTVTKDADGYDMNSALVTYSLVDAQLGTVYATGLTGNSAVIKPVNKGAQRFLEIKVVPETSTGVGEAALTQFAPCGTPYELPFEEEWSGSQYNWGVAWSDNSAYNICAAASLQVPNPPTFTSTVLNVIGTTVGAYTTMRSGLIYVPEDAVNPTLSFWHISYGAEDANEMRIFVNGELFWKTDFIEETPGWYFKMADFSAFKGKVIQVDFQCMIMAYTYIVIDDIRLSNLPDKDMAVLSIQGPASVKADTPATYGVFIENAGAKTAKDWTLTVTFDGEFYGSINGPDMPIYRKGLFSLTDAINMAQEERLYNAQIDWDEDENLENNTLATPLKVKVVRPFNPAPELAAELAEDQKSVTLTWEAPVLDDSEIANKHIEDSFEDLTAFEKYYPGFWTTVDGDGAVVGGISGVDLPGLETGIATAGFFVVDTDYLEKVCGFSYRALRPRSGSKMMATLMPYYGEPLNDWLISPVLSGKAQQLTFYAKSTMVMNPEALRVRYTTAESTDTINFTEVALDIPNLPAGSWQYYIVDLPEGTTHFAFQSYSDKGFMLLIDDVEFDAGEQYANNQVSAYNVYRNGELKKVVDADTMSMADLGLAKGHTYSYGVSAVYEQTGESGLSNVVEVTPTEVSAIADAVAGFEARGGNRMIYVGGVADQVVTITDVAGRVVVSDAVSTDSRFYMVAPGIYLVSANGATTKVLVK